MATCGFCGVEISASPTRDLGEGETGGICEMTEYACAWCGLRAEHCFYSKVLWIQERWTVTAGAPVAGHPGPSPCPRCSGRLCGAMPDGLPTPTYRRSDIRWRREVEHRCSSCGGCWRRTETGFAGAAPERVDWAGA